MEDEYETILAMEMKNWIDEASYEQLLSKWEKHPACAVCGTITTLVEPDNRICKTRVVWVLDKKCTQVCRSCRYSVFGKKKGGE